MKKELDYFTIEQAYGGNQDWFSDIMMKMGGCAAVTACDSCIYFDLYKSTSSLYPFDKSNITKKEYIDFSKKMKPYLRPRLQGINTLKLYVEGFGEYLKDKGTTDISLKPFSGDEAYSLAKEKVMEQIEANFLIPMLVLRHQNQVYRDYVWHWFLITGYQMKEDESDFSVKVVTYGAARWLNFKELWDTGYANKGGLILFQNKV